MNTRRVAVQDIEPETSPFARQCLRRVELPPGSNVIDVPCGLGRHSVWLATLGHKVTALDIDAHRVETTEKRLRELSGRHSFRCQISDAERSLPVEECSFDL